MLRPTNYSGSESSSLCVSLGASLPVSVGISFSEICFPTPSSSTWNSGVVLVINDSLLWTPLVKNEYTGWGFDRANSLNFSVILHYFCTFSSQYRFMAEASPIAEPRTLAPSPIWTPVLWKTLFASSIMFFFVISWHFGPLIKYR